MLVAVLALGLATGCQAESQASMRVIPDSLSEGARIEIVDRQPVCHAQEQHCVFTRIQFGVGLSNGHTVIGNGFEVLGEFDSAGAFVRSVGRRGSGPGEYRAIQTLSANAANSVIVFDVSDMRLVSYDSTGAIENMIRVSADPTMFFAGTRLVGESLYGLSSPLARSITDTVQGTLREITADGRPREIVTIPMPALVVSEGEYGKAVASLFLHRPQWGVAGSGEVVVAPSSDYAIRRMDKTGKNISEFRVGVAPLAVSKSDVQAGIASLAKGAPGNAGAYLREAEENAAKTFPAIAEVFVQRDGAFWIKRASSLTSDSVRWDHFSAASVLDGYMILPREARILDEQASRLLIVSKDSSDLDNAAWYRLKGLPIAK